MNVPVFLTTTLGAVLIIAYWTFTFYKESIVTRWVESTLVASEMAYITVTNTQFIYERGVTPVLRGDAIKLVILIASILLFTQFIRKWRVLVRWPMAIIVGVGIALSIRTVGYSEFISQIIAIAQPLTGSADTVFTGIVLVISVITTLAYFTFTREHKGPIGAMAKIGRYFMMLGFGAAFAMMTLARSGDLIAATTIILQWLGLWPYPT